MSQRKADSRRKIKSWIMKYEAMSDRFERLRLLIVQKIIYTGVLSKYESTERERSYDVYFI